MEFSVLLKHTADTFTQVYMKMEKKCLWVWRTDSQMGNKEHSLNKNISVVMNSTELSLNN